MVNKVLTGSSLAKHNVDFKKCGNVPLQVLFLNVIDYRDTNGRRLMRWLLLLTEN